MKRKEADAKPNPAPRSPAPRSPAPRSPAPRPPGRPASSNGAVSLRLASAAFVTAPFLLLLPDSDFIAVVLVAAGVVLAWIGLRRSGRRPGFAVAGLIVFVVLLELTLTIAMPLTRLVVVPAVSDHPELQEAIGHIKLIFPDTGGASLSTLLGLLAGALLVAGGLLLRCRQS